MRGWRASTAAPSVGPADREAAESLLSAVGATLWFEREEDLDAVTAVSGSGPAYVFYAIEALESAARGLGLAEGASRSLALWTFVGAAKLAIERAEDPAKLRAPGDFPAAAPRRPCAAGARGRPGEAPLHRGGARRMRTLAGAGARHSGRTDVLAQALAFLLDAAASVFILAALLRFWMQAFRAPARNPIAYFSMAVTDWAVRPLRRVIPGIAKLDWSSLLVAWIFEFALQYMLVAILSGAWPPTTGPRSR